MPAPSWRYGIAFWKAIMNVGPPKPQPTPAIMNDTMTHSCPALDGVNSSIDTLQRQQQAEGYGLRGDIASKHASMKLNLAKAQNAIEHNDAARAKRYAQLATADLEGLEKFLGR